MNNGGLSTGGLQVVLGAYGGVGSTLSKRLRGLGLPVLLLGRDKKRLAALGSEIDCPFEVVDLADFAELDQALSAHHNKPLPITGIANTAGSLLLKPAHLTSQAELTETLSANITTAFAAVHCGAKLMMKRGGSIVLISSAAAQVGLPNHEAIASAKGAVESLVRSAASSYAPYKIRVNAVAPGLTQTPLTSRITSNQAAVNASLVMHALGRLGEPEDIASAVSWLMDREQSWVTGQVLGVDGGLSKVRSRSS